MINIFIAHEIFHTRKRNRKIKEKPHSLHMKRVKPPALSLNGRKKSQFPDSDKDMAAI